MGWINRLLGKREMVSEKCGYQLQPNPMISTDLPKETQPPYSSVPSNMNPKLTVRIPEKNLKKIRPIFWICDCSESMRHRILHYNLEKIDVINKILPDVIEQTLEYSYIFKHAQITLRTIKFSDHAEWVDKENIPVDQYIWKNLSAGGRSALGEAFNKLAQELKPIDEGGTLPSRPKPYPPLLVLITDGYPTDDWESGLRNLNAQFWGREADRIVIVLEGADENILRTFLGEDVDDVERKFITIRDLIEKRSFERILHDQTVRYYEGRPLGISKK